MSTQPICVGAVEPLGLFLTQWLQIVYYDEMMWWYNIN